AITSNRLHHAVLLYGESVQKLEQLAKHCAEKLLETREPAKHPDFFELRPSGKARNIKIGSESDRAGGEWPVNTMRWLLEKLCQTSNAGGKKVAVVYEADRLNTESANSFLKTLEEPFPGTFIFMLTARPNNLLDTIKSRCIHLRVPCQTPKIDDEAWAEWLEDFSKWQKALVAGFDQNFTPSDALMQSYSMLARFDEILSRLSDMEEKLLPAEQENIDEEQIEAMRASERRRLRKRMLSEIEDEMLNSAMEASNGKVPSTKLSRATQALEKSAALMELNMQDTPALEYFFLASLRAWSR
ncbi:MAG: hypothetical protein J6T16_07795, partial [Opitutales bacterium]|nr:hypothetical protein [Opitutales bacterium]